ncbi:MAG: hypothetical protein Kow0032_07580 [Methyloligellaceae bacterium]
MKASDIETAANLLKRREALITDTANASSGCWARTDGFLFQPELSRKHCDEAMAEAIRGAIRAELTRRREVIDEDLRALGVDTDECEHTEATGGAA